MCGICGIVTPKGSGRTIDPAAVVRARDTLTHRGPDDSGLHIGPGVGLGHRRLSIVDLAGGHQPMSSPDGRSHIVYNGEIYNHLDLRRDLENAGCRYRTRSDTETVLHLYEAEGPAGVRRLRGMFAFAIWNEERRELFLARDRIGIKPLYYARLEDGSLCFASEIKAILALGPVRPALDPLALPGYLANHAPSGERTMFAGVHRLLPGHTLMWRDGEVTVARFWEPGFVAPDDKEADSERLARAPAEFLERLTESVELRLMADVPLGVFLSGGIDSAAITGIMARLVDEPIRSFSVAFAERSANELGYARTVAEAFRTDHHEITVGPDQFFDALPALVWHEDEPIAHPSSVPLHFVARLAADHVKVVLTGEGSDELLGGYARYWKTIANVRLGRLLPSAGRRLSRALIRTMPDGWRLRHLAERTFAYLPPDLASIYLDNFAVFSRERQAELWSPAMRAVLDGAGPYAWESKRLGEHAELSLLDRLLSLDLQTYLHELLMKQDQMSMAASIESRVPFLDHQLVEWVVKLPDEWKLDGRATKRILRESLAGVLPESILSRPKMGFPVPFGRWARGQYGDRVREIVAGPRARERGLFDPGPVDRMLAEHAAGRRDHSERLWSLLNLELWHRTFLDGEPVSRALPIPSADRAAS